MNAGDLLWKLPPVRQANRRSRLYAAYPYPTITKSRSPNARVFGATSYPFRLPSSFVFPSMLVKVSPGNSELTVDAHAEAAQP